MKRPLIGITPGLSDTEGSLVVNRGHSRALLFAGAMPVVLPLMTDESELQDALGMLDGVVFSGGVDVDPELFGQHQMPGCGSISPLRDAMELPLARMLFESTKPALGICRGMQVLNIAAGGDVWQDLPSCPLKTLQHRQRQPERFPSHPVAIENGSKLLGIVESETLMVNSLHHQAVRQPGTGFRSCAVSPDGVIEAIEHSEHPFMLGLQWHPELMWEHDLASRKLFLAFVKACSQD